MNEYPFEPMWSRQEVEDHVRSGWDLIPAVFAVVMVVVICVWIAFGNRPQIVTADIVGRYHAPTYQVGSDHHGPPTSEDVRACVDGEVIYYPEGWSADLSDVWVCEAPSLPNTQ